MPKSERLYTDVCMIYSDDKLYNASKYLCLYQNQSTWQIFPLHKLF